MESSFNGWMSFTITLYTHHSLKVLRELHVFNSGWLDEHLDDIEQRLKGDERLGQLDRLCDELCAVELHSVIEGLSLEDFEYDHELQDEYAQFFKEVQGCVSFVGLTDPSLNPLLTSYMEHWLMSVKDGLIDLGGLNEVIRKSIYLEQLKSLPSTNKWLEALPKPKEKNRPLKVHDNPIQFLIDDIVRLMDQSSEQALLTFEDDINQQAKLLTLWGPLKNKVFDARDLLSASGLHPKDFGDSLERLRLLMRRSLLQ
jgi:hypothetical protein